MPTNATLQNPFQVECKSVVTHECDTKNSNSCPSGEQCINNGKGQNVCVCLNGFVRDQVTNICRDVRNNLVMILKSCISMSIFFTNRLTSVWKIQINSHAD